MPTGMKTILQRQIHMTDQPEIEEIAPAATGKGLLTTFGVSLYPQELDYIDHLSAIYGTSRAATIRTIINRHRIDYQDGRTN